MLKKFLNFVKALFRKEPAALSLEKCEMVMEAEPAVTLESCEMIVEPTPALTLEDCEMVVMPAPKKRSHHKKVVKKEA